MTSAVALHCFRCIFSLPPTEMFFWSTVCAGLIWFRLDLLLLLFEPCIAFDVILYSFSCDV